MSLVDVQQFRLKGALDTHYRCPLPITHCIELKYAIKEKTLLHKGNKENVDIDSV